jgi:hypothetical protein
LNIKGKNLTITFNSYFYYIPQFINTFYTKVDLSRRKELIMNTVNCTVAIPDNLYHYTSKEGLKGIIRDKKIRATNMRFFDDYSELQLSIDRALGEFINRTKNGLMSKEDKDFLNDICNVFTSALWPNANQYSNIYVCSFSTAKDDLYAWMGHCPKKADCSIDGYSIGFDFNTQLLDCVNKQGFNLVKCVYDKENQLVIIRKVLNDALNFFRIRRTKARCDEYQDECVVNDTGKDISERRCINENNALNCAIHRACIKFFQITPSIKNTAFHGEEEWRLISKPLKLDSSVKYTGKPKTIPYIEINLSNNKDESLYWIPEIWIGPKAKKRKPYDGLENLLAKEDQRLPKLEKFLLNNKVSYENSTRTRVEVSRIPIRANETRRDIKKISLYNKWKRIAGRNK